MNIGYTNQNNKNTEQELLICPICDSDIHTNKHGYNFYCANKECALSGKNGKYRNARELVDLIEKLMKIC